MDKNGPELKSERRDGIEFKVKEAGFCCSFAFCNIMQKPAVRGHPRTSANAMALKFGVSRHTIHTLRSRFDTGKIMCQGSPNCQKHLWEKEGEPVQYSIDYPATFRYATGDKWYITFRDFTEIKEYIESDTWDKVLLVASLVLEKAINDRIIRKQLVPLPTRAWEGDRLIEVPARMVERLMNYRKFFLHKKREPDVDYGVGD